MDDDTGSGQGLVIEVLSAPTTNPETYRVTYEDTASDTHYATVTILIDGTAIWAPAVPVDVTDVTNVEALMPAWQLVTQDFLDANPDWEGLVGMVIYVADGTYNEVFEVDTPGLHLKNFPDQYPVIDADGATVGSGDHEAAVWLSAGCTGIEGFTITDSGANGISVYLNSSKCKAAEILDVPENTTCAYGRVNIVNNNIYGNEGNGIRVISAVVLILDNIIHGNVDDGIDGCFYCGVECVDPEAITHSPACSEIIYNEIYENGPSGNGEWEVGEPPRFTSDPTACGEYPGWTDSGIQVRCVGFGPRQDPSDEMLYIVHNNIHDNYHAGIYLWEDATIGGNLTIQANKLIDNGIFGLSTRAAIPDRVDFRYNDIIGNTYWGVKNWDDDNFTAKENYWGMPGGPSEGPAPIVQCIECRCHEEDQRSDALGNGDAVSHRVHYNPWLYTSSANIFHESSPIYMIRAFGSDSLELQKGWNTLSVPCSLLSSYNSIPEIAYVDIDGFYNEGLGNFLYVIETSPGVYDSNFDLVLAWNTTTGYWDNIGADQTALTNLKPGLGYYIRMKEPSRFPVLYSDVIGLPAVPLDDGWNLIGAPWGIDREKDCCAEDQGRWGVASPDAGDPEAFKPVWEALESIKEGNGGTKGVAIVVSPSVPGQISIWSASVTSGFWDPIYNNKEMATGEGYWVFMVNPATYGGFEITPFYYT
ncbi:MAG: hypothetical protein GKC05_06815 [Methanomicrobiales archaeon]|nr:hypothetical protein [Methanomicrobiales archaeon]